LVRNFLFWKSHQSPLTDVPDLGKGLWVNLGIGLLLILQPENSLLDDQFFKDWLKM